MGRPRCHVGPSTLVRFPRKAMLLAAFLLFDCPEKEASRDKAAAFLWENAGYERRSGNLRVLIWRLRALQATHGAPLFRFDDSSVGLSRANVQIDAELLDRLETPGAATKILEVCGAYSGNFLQGLEGETDIARWLRIRRARLQRKFVSFVAAWLENPPNGASIDEMALVARKLLAVDSLHETGHRVLMWTDIANGKPDAARKRYERFAEKLRSEFEAQPLQATRGLIKSLGNGAGALSQARRHAQEAASPAARGAPPSSAQGVHSASVESRLTSRSSRAVEETEAPTLYFTTTSTSAFGAADPFYSAFLDDLFAQLWNPRARRIVIDGDGLALRAAAQARNVGNAYGVHISLWGDQPTQLSVRICYALTGDMLWAKSFQLNRENSGAVSARVADSIICSLEDNRIEAARNSGEGSPPTLAIFAAARRALLKADLPAVRRARRLYRMASHTDGGGPESRVGISRTLWCEWLLRAGEDANLLPYAIKLCREALETHPDDPQAFRELGMAALYSKDYHGALECLSRARQLSPDDRELVFDFADALIADGSASRALELIESLKQVEKPPSDFNNWVAATGYYIVGQYNSAIEKLSAMREAPATYRLRAISHAMLGDVDQAKEFMTKTMDENPSFDMKTWLSLCPSNSVTDIKHFEEGYISAGFKR